MINDEDETHTPGPWHIGMKPGPTVYGPQGEQITWSANPLLDEHEHLANQRLIAAAPDLLEACRKAQLLIHYLLCGTPDEAYDLLVNQGEKIETLLRHTIAKAEGRG